jgi:hypothetical protein
MMVARFIGVVELVAAIVILLLGLREARIRANWVEDFRALRKRCVTWQVA